MREKTAAGTILLTLAARLPDDQLREFFPAAAPESIRETLRDIAGRMAPPEKTEKVTAPSRENGGGLDPSLLKRQAKGCILYADGASRGNPGEAGAGIVLLDEKGREIAAGSFYLGQCTNNAAEYQALIAGLETAIRSGCTTLSIHLDSELIVRQVTGRYRVKNAQLQPLFIKVTSLLGRLESWTIRHIPRAENARADELANKGIDDRQQQK